MATVNAITQGLTLTPLNVQVIRTGIIWPTDLPGYFFARNYSETNRAQTIRSEVDVGLPQVRRRYSRILKEINGSMRMSQTQLDSFEAWYNDILKGGTQTFLMTNPLNDQVRTMRIKDFNSNHEGGVYYQISFNMEIMP